MPAAASYLLSEQAEADLVEIGAYTESVWGDRQAHKFVDAIEAAFVELAINPKMGVAARWRGPTPELAFFSGRFGSTIARNEITC